MLKHAITPDPTVLGHVLTCINHDNSALSSGMGKNAAVVDGNRWKWSRSPLSSDHIKVDFSKLLLEGGACPHVNK